MRLQLKECGGGVEAGSSVWLQRTAWGGESEDAREREETGILGGGVTQRHAGLRRMLETLLYSNIYIHLYPINVFLNSR